MSDHPKEAERDLKRIVICDDICLDAFHWLKPGKLGKALALVSRRFDALVDEHFRSRKWAIGGLGIGEGTDGNPFTIKLRRSGYKKVFRFVPQSPLPHGVIGFGYLYCWSTMNDEVITFLRRISRLFQSDITLFFNYPFNANFFDLIRPLLNLSAIEKMSFLRETDHPRLISPTLFRDCVNVRFVHTYYINPSLQFPPDDSDSAEASDGKMLCKWLHTPRDDGKPKMLHSKSGGIPVDELKTKFLSASTGVSFIIFFAGDNSSAYYDYDSSVAPFQLENWLTGERLSLRLIENNDGIKWVLVRGPIDRNVNQWAQWEREASEKELDWKLFIISGYDEDGNDQDEQDDDDDDGIQ